MAQIFLSYSRDDQRPASDLAKDLKDLGHAVWLDQELTGGQAWWDQILARIRASDLFVFVLSSAALYSTACQREYGYAAELRRPILPVLVREGLSLNVLPPALSQVQFIDFRERHVEAIIALSRALQSLPVGVPLPDPLPAPPEVPLSYLATLSQQVETPAALSFDEQSRLVVELKRGLRDPATFQDSRDLLGRLRARRDLLATIAEEIDEVVVREPKRQRMAPGINLRASVVSSSKEHSFSLNGTSRPKQIAHGGFIPRLLSWSPSDPLKLRRVAEQWIWAHWLLWLLPWLVFWVSESNNWFQLGIQSGPGPMLTLCLVVGAVNACLLWNLIPLISAFSSFLPVGFVLFIPLGFFLSYLRLGSLLSFSPVFLICGMISGFLSQRIIQRSRKRLAALH